MEIEIDVDLLDEGEKEKLRALFKTNNEVEFKTALQGIAYSAITEYKEMLLGKGLPTRADEIKQHRLYHLIKHYFNGRIPSEAEVSSMFQLTDSESKALIRNVKTKFRYQLEKEISYTLRNVISSAEFNESKNEYHVVIQSDNVLEELNRLISTYAPQLDPITKVRGSARKFQISEDSYALLENKLNAEQEVAISEPIDD
ncbi:hypothetical protein J2S17_004648 [Cytobacillus purgationiresistens]|uniref:Uncharacterized protein n=1 Tax=Cytobacillus purgationiresistens TaxID=863449 RepID=A0ABU0ANI3_9BACI|nr:hypothetical protein [Cytobacillus purgationiresistens]